MRCCMGGIKIEIIKENADMGESIEEVNQLMSLEEALANLNSLIGMKTLKDEILKVVELVKYNEDILKEKPNLKLFPFHYIFTIDKANGLTTVLRLISIIFYHLKIIKAYEFKEYSLEDIYSLAEYGDNGEIGLAAIHGMEKFETADHELIEKLWSQMSDSYGKLIYVLVIPASQKGKAHDLINKLKYKVGCRYLEFPSYTNKQLTHIGKHILSTFGYQLDTSAERQLAQKIDMLSKHPNFQNIKTVENLVHSIRVEKFFNNKRSHSKTAKPIKIKAADFESAAKKQSDVAIENTSDENITLELDAMIGMSQIKKKVEEIAYSLVAQKKLIELGISSDPINLHMQFTGSPGTGKTSVARIIGKVFKEMGIIEKGELYETSREDFVGKYLGFTAIKTKEKIEEAVGSVLFIDEAYSLILDKEDMYGYEAIATLVKEMENKRDKMVIILAGYTDELNELLKTNPGLRDRIPHKIHFPDYTHQELTEIFLKLLGKDYFMAPEVLDRIAFLFQSALKGNDKYFGNGRFARNVMERLKMKQAKRLYLANSYSRKELLTIEMEDVEELFKEPEIAKYISGENSKRRIGFI